MTTEVGYDHDSAAAALAAAAMMAGYAPSIHNTQPWRWRVRGTTLDLIAERSRQLGVTDPAGRLLAVSCGAALHHAAVVLAAESWRTEVTLVPEPDDPDLLAHIEITGLSALDFRRMRDLQTLRIRRTDRRPVADTPVPSGAVDELAEVARDAGASLHVLRPDDVIELAAAADHAQRAEAMDDSWRAEMDYWVHRGGGLGMPDEVIPAQPPQTTVPDRDFGRAGTLGVGERHDSAAVYAILYGAEDTQRSWLQGGEALSATWLRAIQLGLSLLPLSAVVEVPSTRQILRGLLAGVGEPYLVIRLGNVTEDDAMPQRTPRLPAEQVVEIVS